MEGSTSLVYRLCHRWGACPFAVLILASGHPLFYESPMSDLCITPHANDFAACVRGVNLAQALSPADAGQIRALWLRYQVLYFPDQALTHPQLERFTETLGPYGHDPFVTAVKGHRHILEVRREPGEHVVPFGSSWHSDWSFQAAPPSATILHSKIVPPVGGATHFADGIRALATLPIDLRRAIHGRSAIHSAWKTL